MRNLSQFHSNNFFASKSYVTRSGTQTLTALVDPIFFIGELLSTNLMW